MSTISSQDIASLCLQPSPGSKVQLAQTEHRIALLSKWDIPQGAKVLELGCGQGDCTAVLAEAVGPTGHVTALDPADLSYGAPFTLGQAQAHLSAGRLGSRITWVQADPLTFLSESTAQFDVAVLAHCLWYFHSPSQIATTLAHVAARARRVCVAEWSLACASGSVAAHTHVLAVLAQAALEVRKAAPESNVRTIVTPARITALAQGAGLALVSEARVVPVEGVLDGSWETGGVMSKAFLREVEVHVHDEREKGLVFALRDAVEASLQNVDGGTKGVRSMDVWCGVFTPAENVAQA